MNNNERKKMSGLCLINLCKHNMNYEELNKFSREIVFWTYEKNMDVHFNSIDYSNTLVKENNMECFFTLSDSFLHENACFLEMHNYAYLNGEKYKNKFYKDFSF